MATNKVVYNGTTLIDLESDTATASDVVSGAYFHTAAGVRTQGSLQISHWYTGSSEPSSSLGSNGDLYFMTG